MCPVTRTRIILRYFDTLTNSSRLEFVNGVTDEFLSETLSLFVVSRDQTVTTILRQYRALIHEAHLLGVGLKTTAQLQAFREEFQTYGSALSLWVSSILTLHTRSHETP